jgi:hypothetical protein
MTDESSLRHGEQILASACRFLAEGGENELARLMATGALAARPRTELDPFFGDERTCLHLDFVAPRALYEALDADPQWDDRAAALWNAIDAVVPAGYVGGRRYVRAALIDPPDDWRNQYAASEHETSGEIAAGLDHL